MSEISDFARIMKISDASWKQNFKKWFDMMMNDYTVNIRMCLSSSSNNPDEIRQSAETADFMAQTVARSILNAPVEPEQDLSDRGQIKNLFRAYRHELGGWERLMKKGLWFICRHPFRTWHKWQKLRKADVPVSLKSLVHIARARFIKEGGTAKDFAALMTA